MNRQALTKFNFKKTLLQNPGHVVYKEIAQNPVLLPNIKEMALVYSNNGPGRAGMRYFLKNRSPIIRFHNPGMHFQIKVEKEYDVKPRIDLTFRRNSSFF